MSNDREDMAGLDAFEVVGFFAVGIVALLALIIWGILAW